MNRAGERAFLFGQIDAHRDTLFRLVLRGAFVAARQRCLCRSALVLLGLGHETCREHETRDRPACGQQYLTNLGNVVLGHFRFTLPWGSSSPTHPSPRTPTAYGR